MSADWCFICGGDPRTPEHEELCAIAAASFAPEGIESLIGPEADE